MKTFKLGALALSLSLNCFAFTDAEALRVAFNNDNFVDLIGEDKIESVEISKESSGFKVTVNDRAPMVDGCAYEASLEPETFAINPLTTGVKLVLVEKKAICGLLPE